LHLPPVALARLYVPFDHRASHHQQGQQQAAAQPQPPAHPPPLRFGRLRTRGQQIALRLFDGMQGSAAVLHQAHALAAVNHPLSGLKAVRLAHRDGLPKAGNPGFHQPVQLSQPRLLVGVVGRQPVEGPASGLGVPNRRFECAQVGRIAGKQVVALFRLGMFERGHHLPNFTENLVGVGYPEMAIPAAFEIGIQQPGEYQQHKGGGAHQDDSPAGGRMDPARLHPGVLATGL
jgi:hypothetical protein